MGITTPEQARAVVTGVGGGTSLQRGQEIYEFVREHRLAECLELGFAHGVSSVWIGAALEANGAGQLTCVDIQSAREREPSAQQLLEKAGLTHRATLNFEETSYTFFLQRLLRDRLRDGRVEPLYDFIFLDGAHTWDTDALAFLIVDRLLKPGGWLLLDDLEWKPPPDGGATDYEVNLAAIGAIWETLIVPDPTYDDLRTDGLWGWAHKSTTPVPQVRTIVKRDLVGSLRQIARMTRRKLRA
jgi:predicted O-methyltransferase YrrM